MAHSITRYILSALITLILMGDDILIGQDLGPSTDNSFLSVGPYLYWMDKGPDTINRGNIDGLGLPTVLFDASDGVGIGGFGGQNGLEIDDAGGKIYWSEKTRIVRANIDGSGSIEVLYDGSDGLVGVVEIELSLSRGMIYWSDSASRVIQRAPLSGSGTIETLFSSLDPGIRNTFGIALDLASGKIYWASLGYSPGPDVGIFRGDIDGGNVERVVEVLRVLHVALDLSAQMIYWTTGEPENRGVKRMALDGSDLVESLYESFFPSFVVLDRANQLLYWSDENENLITRGSMDGSAPEEVLYDDLIHPEGLVMEGALGDITIHLERPLDPAWGPPKISYASTSPLNSSIAQPGISMSTEGCRWFSYTVRATSSITNLAFAGNSTGLNSQGIIVSGAAELWFDLSDPGGGADWLIGGGASPPASYEDCDDSIELDLKVALSGPYDSTTDLMKQGLLEKGLLPTSQGYGHALFFGSPQFYGGSESSLELGPGASDAVDWVIVELRTGPNDPLSTVASKAGLLRSDGKITDPDFGASTLHVPAPSGDYYLVVRHRNHLPVMSSVSIFVDAANIGSYDFTTSSSQAFGINPMIQVNNSPVRFALRSGDGNADQSVSAFDFTTIWLPSTGSPDAYDQADYNLDGSFTAFDFTLNWLPNSGQTSQVPD